MFKKCRIRLRKGFKFCMEIAISHSQRWRDLNPLLRADHSSGLASSGAHLRGHLQLKSGRLRAAFYTHSFFLFFLELSRYRILELFLLRLETISKWICKGAFCIIFPYLACVEDLVIFLNPFFIVIGTRDIFFTYAFKWQLHAFRMSS